jgi:NADH-ubiquinone oxidoreductase chain 2
MFTNTLNYHKKNIDPIYINRLTNLTILVSILLSFNVLYFQSIGKGIPLYNDLFQVTIQSQIIEIFLLLVGMSILSGWPKILWSNKLKDTNNHDHSANNKISASVFTVTSSTQTPESTSSSLLHSSNGREAEGTLDWINKDTNNVSIYKSDQYSLIALFSILGGSLLMSSFDLLSMYLSIELQSFALYILATLNKDKLTATSAGLKYFLLGGLSSCFILLGSAIIYSYTGLTQLESLNFLLSLTHLPSLYGVGLSKAFTIGLIILMVGFLFKLSAAPFYQWAPDVYDGTPTIVTVWLTIVAKLTIFIFIQGFLEFSLVPDISIINVNLSSNETSLISVYNIKNLLLICSLLSLIIGTIAGLSQIKIKRLLAFSSVSHVGFLLLALGIYTQKSIDAFIFYLIQYSVTSLNIFLIVLAFGYTINKYLMPYVPLHYYSSFLPIADNKKESITVQGESREIDLNYLYQLKGQMIQNPLLSSSFAICLLSMAGIPPLIGFFSKQFVLFSSIENGNIFISVVAILVSVISASYYLKLIKLSFFNKTDIKDNLPSILNPKSDSFLSKEEGRGSTSVTWYEGWELKISQIHSLIISILTFIILLFFLNPSIILNGTSLISLTFFNI